MERGKEGRREMCGFGISVCAHVSIEVSKRRREKLAGARMYRGLKVTVMLLNLNITGTE